MRGVFRPFVEKTWLRNSMLQERFNNTKLLFIEKEISKYIDTETIIDIFAQINKYIQLKKKKIVTIQYFIFYVLVTYIYLVPKLE